jgi:GT2 family glycosyltransferase
MLPQRCGCGSTRDSVGGGRSAGTVRAVPVSVVIPCFNSLRFLPEAVDSVLAQTYADLDVVLVDDGGDDDLAGWAAGRGDARVRVVRQANAGVSAARNRGVAEACGDLVAFLDSDDTWEPGLVATLADRMASDPSLALAFSGYDVVDAEGRPTGRVHVVDWYGDVWERLVTDNPIAASAVMVRREVFTGLGGFRVNRDRFPIDVEDWELWLRIAERHPVAGVAEVLAHHRRHDSNSSSDVESLDAAYRHLLGVLFDGRTDERSAMRPAATAHCELLLAWHSLTDRHDADRAAGYLRSAERHHPAVRRTPEFWRARGATAAMAVLGPSGYGLVRDAGRRARRVFPR